MLLCAQLVNTMREVLSQRDWWHLPRFVYGSSRGGAMALIMAQRFPFQARSMTFLSYALPPSFQQSSYRALGVVMTRPCA